MPNQPHISDHDGEPDEVMLDPNEAAEEIPPDGDIPMESDNEGEDQDGNIEENQDQEVELVNDAQAYFDFHKDSIFVIANHPLYPEELFITGGGDDVAYIWGVFPGENVGENRIIPQEGKLIQKLDGFGDSVIAAGFSKIHGELAAGGGMDGKLKVWRNRQIRNNKKSDQWKLVGEAQEVEEINWIEWHPKEENIIALGAGDGSVWIYEVGENELGVRHALYSHTDSCTAGQWVPTDGSLLCTVSLDGTFYVWDLIDGRSLVGLTPRDQRFDVEGGLVSIAINQEGSVAVVGGGNGTCKVVGLPRSPSTAQAQTSSSTGGKNRGKAVAGVSTQTAGQILATLQSGSNSVESLAFSKPPQPLLASSSVDGTITIFDAARQYTIRKVINNSHEDAVVKVEFAPSSARSAGSLNAPVVLTSCSTDRTVKRWDARTGTELGVWKGHADGILGFVQTERIVVTAGDDHIALLFNTAIAPSTVSSQSTTTTVNEGGLTAR